MLFKIKKNYHMKKRMNIRNRPFLIEMFPAPKNRRFKDMTKHV